VLAVDEEKMRVSLGLKQLTEDPWLRIIPEHYLPGQIVKGKVTKLTNFGVFVEIDHDLEGLLHISELSDDKVETPEDVVKVGQQLSVAILRVDIDDRKIGLSLKRVPEELRPVPGETPAASAPAEAPAASAADAAGAEAAPPAGTSGPAASQDEKTEG